MGNSNLKATDLDPDNFQGKSKSKLFVVIGLASLYSILLQYTHFEASFDILLISHLV